MLKSMHTWKCQFSKFYGISVMSEAQAARKYNFGTHNCIAVWFLRETRHACYKLVMLTAITHCSVVRPWHPFRRCSSNNKKTQKVLINDYPRFITFKFFHTTRKEGRTKMFSVASCNYCVKYIYTRLCYLNVPLDQNLYFHFSTVLHRITFKRGFVLLSKRSF